MNNDWTIASTGRYGSHPASWVNIDRWADSSDPSNNAPDSRPRLEEPWRDNRGPGKGANNEWLKDVTTHRLI